MMLVVGECLLAEVEHFIFNGLLGSRQCFEWRQLKDVLIFYFGYGMVDKFLGS